MARINLVDPKILTDEHLMEEYRNLPSILSALRKTLNSKSGFNPNKIKKVCPLGEGHVYFFYDKLTYLRKRYLNLIKEMRDRGFNPRPKEREVDFSGFPKVLYRDYRPSKGEKDFLKQRIIRRIKSKPSFYHYKRKTLNETYFQQFIKRG